LASYAVQAPERLPLESTNLLIAGAVHFTVFVEVADIGSSAFDTRYLSVRHPDQVSGDFDNPLRFAAIERRRFVSSVQEVVGSEGLHVISNEVFRRGKGGRACQAAPLRTSTLEELVDCGFEPSLRDVEAHPW
jgi:hypothetical protein